MERNQIVRFVLTALFAALVAAGAFIKIPLVPAPMTLQTLFALIASTCLPTSLAVSSIVVYLLLGAIGLPIFTSGGGLAAMFGPTGGYLIGMVPAVLAGSLMIVILPASRIRLAVLLSSLVNTFFIYLIGVPWLGHKMGISLSAAFVAGFLPFAIGDALKIAITTAVSPVIRPRIQDMLNRE